MIDREKQKILDKLEKKKKKIEELIRTTQLMGGSPPQSAYVAEVRGEKVHWKKIK